MAPTKKQKSMGSLEPISNSAEQLLNFDKIKQQLFTVQNELDTLKLLIYETSTNTNLTKDQANELRQEVAKNISNNENKPCDIKTAVSLLRDYYTKKYSNYSEPVYPNVQNKDEVKNYINDLTTKFKISGTINDLQKQEEDKLKIPIKTRKPRTTKKKAATLTEQYEEFKLKNEQPKALTQEWYSKYVDSQMIINDNVETPIVL